MALYVAAFIVLGEYGIKIPLTKALDDQVGVDLVNRIYGAFLLQTLRALHTNSELNESVLPDVEIGLERFTRWGNFVEQCLVFKSAFLTVVRGYGVKLFRDRSDSERRESRLNAYKQFLEGALGMEMVIKIRGKVRRRRMRNLNIRISILKACGRRTWMWVAILQVKIRYE